MMSSLGNAEIFARNLRYYVESSGKLAKDIAEAIGVAPATFSEWMNGKKYPRICNIEALARYFHVEKSDFIEEHNPKSDGMTVKVKHTETRILAQGFDKLPEDARKKALEMMDFFFDKYFDNEKDGDSVDT